MSYQLPARTAARRVRSTLLASAVIVSAVLLGDLAYQAVTPSASSATSPIAIKTLDGLKHAIPHHHSPVGVADGVVPDGTTVFDDDVPAVANLKPDLLRALRQAATDAGHYGIEFDVNSGWRSPAYQDQLLREAVSKYGSMDEAARWVATPKTSAHVSGDAVDIGPTNAAAWLSRNGAAYGLCQIYGNEIWHYELRPSAIDHGCPAMYADPTHDPRMQN